MKKLLGLIILTATLFSCVNDKDLYIDESGPEYAKSFSNVTTVNVNINSKYNATYYSVFYEFPYEDGDLTKVPALTGVTPIYTTLDVPNDVNKLYVVGDGILRTFNVGDVEIVTTRSAVSTNAIDAKVVEYINGSCFPEAANNVRGENLFSCTDLVIDKSAETGEFDKAEVWLTYINDGGFMSSGAYYGNLWFYTYPTDKLTTGMTIGDVKFYGLSKATQEIIEIPYSDIQARKNYVFASKEEQVNGASSFKRVKLGTFEKGLNIGFVYWGTATDPNAGVRFSTPLLNAKVNKEVTYRDGSGKFNIANKYVSNGFIRHIKVDDSTGKTFEGNVLGMENRTPIEGSYDGDYNDMLCLIESNPLALKPAETIDDATPAEFKTEKGVYLFEDNYPARGDYDFNDAVVEFSIVDYYKSSNNAKQVSARLLGKGCVNNNTFGFKSKSGYAPFIEGIQGYSQVDGAVDPTLFSQWTTQTMYGDILPYLQSGEDKIVDPETYNTGEYPYVLVIPYATSEFMFRWCLEKRPLDEAYHFAGNRASDWYKTPANTSKVVSW